MDGGRRMSNSRLIYFSDEAFNRLESMNLYDNKGKPLSRAKKINWLILDKFKLIDVDNISKQKVERVKERILLKCRDFESSCTFKFDLCNEKYPLLMREMKEMRLWIFNLFEDALQ